MKAPGIIVVSQGGKSYKKLIDYLDKKESAGNIRRVDTIGEALEAIYMDGADILVADVSLPLKKEARGRREGQKEGQRPPLSFNGDVLKVKRYIKEHYRESISLKTLSEVVGICPGHLSRVFRKKEGRSIGAYLESFRMERAKDLLRDEKKKVQDISRRVGYNNVSYFSKTFKKLYGLSPTEFRQGLMVESEKGGTGEA